MLSSAPTCTLCRCLWHRCRHGHVLVYGRAPPSLVEAQPSSGRRRRCRHSLVGLLATLARACASFWGCGHPLAHASLTSGLLATLVRAWPAPTSAQMLALRPKMCLCGGWALLCRWSATDFFPASVVAPHMASRTAAKCRRGRRKGGAKPDMKGHTFVTDGLGVGDLRCRCGRHHGRGHRDVRCGAKR